MQHVFLLGVDLRTLSSAPSARAALLRQVIDRVQAIPGVTSIAFADRPPFLGHGTADSRNPDGSYFSYVFNRVSDRYFETLGIPFLAGRDFTPRELERQDPVVIVSDSAARHFWPGQDAIGQRVSTHPDHDIIHNSYTVIGVVKSVRSTYLSKQEEAFLYFPKPLSNTFGSMLVHTRMAPESAYPSASPPWPPSIRTCRRRPT